MKVVVDEAGLAEGDSGAHLLRRSPLERGERTPSDAKRPLTLATR